MKYYELDISALHYFKSFQMVGLRDSDFITFDIINHTEPSVKNVTVSTRQTSHTLDIHMSVHRKYNYKLQPTRCNVSYLFISTDALHVSGGSSAHHQEHITVHTASGIVNQCCCC